MDFDFSTGRKPLSVFSLAGLTDIVLLLLIFFLLTSSFVAPQGVPVNLPRAAAEVPEQSQFLTVTITAEGTFYVENAETPEEELAEAILTAQGDRTALVLRADQEATVAQFAAVAVAARAAGMRVLLATEQEE